MIRKNPYIAISSRLTFAILLLILIIDALSYGLVISPLVSLLGINPANGALWNLGLISMLSPAYLLAIPIATSCSDKWSRKGVISVCLIISAIGYIVLLTASLTKNIILILCAVVLLDLASGTTPTAQAFITDISTGKQKSYFFALLGFIALGDVSTGMLDNLISKVNLPILRGTTTAISIALTLTVINILICSRLLPKLNHQKQKNNKKSRITLEEITTAFANMFTNPKLNTLFLAFALFEFAASLYSQNSSYYLTQALNLTTQQIQSFSNYKYLLIFVTLIIIYPIIIQYISIKKFIFICLFLCITGMGLNLSFNNYALQWITALLIAPTKAAVTPLLWTMLSDNCEKNFQGILIGITYVVWYFLWILSDIVANFLNYHYLNYSPLLASFMMLITIIVMLLYNKKTSLQNSSITAL